MYDGLQTILKPMAISQKNDFCDNERTRRFCENLCFDGKFRKEAPTEFAGAKVIQTEDFKELTRTDREGNVENSQHRHPTY